MKSKLFSIRSFLESKYYLIFAFVFSWALVSISGLQAVTLGSNLDTQLTLEPDMEFSLSIGLFSASLIFFTFYYLSFYIFVHTKRIDFAVIKKSFWSISVAVLLTIIVQIIIILIFNDVISNEGLMVKNLEVESKRYTRFLAFVILFPSIIIFAFVGISISTKMFIEWQNELKNKYQKPRNIQKY